MSAIIAGKSCKRCGEKFYVSLGHPKWYDDVVKRGKPPCSKFERFESMRKSGMCYNCFQIVHLTKADVEELYPRLAHTWDWDEHSEDYDDFCFCATCRSYMGDDREI